MGPRGLSLGLDLDFSHSGELNMEQCTALGSLCRNSEIAARGPDGSNLLGKSMEEMQVDGLLSAFEGAVPGAWWGHLCVPPLLWVHGQPE